MALEPPKELIHRNMHLSVMRELFFGVVIVNKKQPVVCEPKKRHPVTHRLRKKYGLR